MHLADKKQLTVLSGYTFIVSMCVPWELNPQTFVLQTQCSSTEPQEHVMLKITLCWKYIENKLK